MHRFVLHLPPGECGGRFRPHLPTNTGKAGRRRAGRMGRLLNLPAWPPTPPAWPSGCPFSVKSSRRLLANHSALCRPDHRVERHKTVSSRRVPSAKETGLTQSCKAALRQQVSECRGLPINTSVATLLEEETRKSSSD